MAVVGKECAKDLLMVSLCIHDTMQDLMIVSHRLNVMYKRQRAQESTRVLSSATSDVYKSQHLMRLPHPFARIVIAIVCVLLMPILMGAKRPPGLGDVKDVRSWSYDDYTRVVVELTRPVETEVKRLKADAKSGRPDRLYLDLSGIWVGKDFEKGIPIQDGLLKTLRLGQNTLTKSRLVIDLQRYERHRMLVLRSPHRIVVDV
mgnify:CR=1 FL=1